MPARVSRVKWRESYDFDRRCTGGKRRVLSGTPPMRVSLATISAPVVAAPRQAPAMKQVPTGSETLTNTTGTMRLPPDCSGLRGRFREDHVGLQISQLFSVHARPIDAATGPTNFH